MVNRRVLHTNCYTTETIDTFLHFVQFYMKISLAIGKYQRKGTNYIHFQEQALLKKCPICSFLVRNFPHFSSESPYLVRMRENMDQKNSEYRHFSRIVQFSIIFYLSQISKAMLVIIVLNIVPIDGWKNLLLLNKNRMFQHCQNNFVKSFKASKYCGSYKDCDKIANKLSNIKCSQVFTTHLGIAQCNEIFSCMNLSNKGLCCYFFPCSYLCD